MFIMLILEIIFLFCDTMKYIEIKIYLHAKVVQKYEEYQNLSYFFI